MKMSVITKLEVQLPKNRPAVPDVIEAARFGE
jgi:hypothetical protein